MSVLAFPDPRKSREEASLWLARLDRGLSGRRALVVARLAPGRDEQSRVPRDGKAVAWARDRFRALGALPAESRGAESAAAPELPSIALAAIAAACISAVGTLMLAGDTPWALFDSRPPPRPMLSEMLRTGVGEKRVTQTCGRQHGHAEHQLAHRRLLRAARARCVSLLWGSHIRRGAGSRAAVQRARGQARCQASGTSFNVRVFPDDSVELTVTDGQVKVLYALQQRQRSTTPEQAA